MRLWPFARIEAKQVEATLADPELLNLLSGISPGSISKAQALAVPAVNAAIRAISEPAATLGIRVVKIADDGSETDDPKHPIAKFLQDQVNDWTSAFDFIRDLVAQALTDDRGGLAWVNRVNGEVREIISYKPGVITVTEDAQTGEPSYKIAERSIDARDVIHLRSSFSQCPLTMAMSAIEVAYHLENHAKNLFKNGARPATVIRFKKGLGDEGLKKMKAGWRAAFGGSDQGGRTAVLWDDAEITTLTLNSTDGQFLENRRFQILEIARAFRVPPGMLFELERQTYTNGEQQGKEYLTYSLEPWLRALETCLRRALFNEEDRKTYRIVFDRDDLTRASLTERATAINSLRASKVLNANEGRHWLDLPPYEGGNVYENTNITTPEKTPAVPPSKPVAVAA